MIDRCRNAFTVRMMCRCLKVSQTGYYGWRNRPLNARARDNQRLPERTRWHHDESDGVMGSPSIWDELGYEGETCSKNRVTRPMRVDGLQGIPQPRRWRKKQSNDRPDNIRKHFKRDFNAGEPNTKVGDLHSC